MLEFEEIDDFLDVFHIGDAELFELGWVFYHFKDVVVAVGRFKHSKILDSVKDVSQVFTSHVVVSFSD